MGYGGLLHSYNVQNVLFITNVLFYLDSMVVCCAGSIRSIRTAQGRHAPKLNKIFKTTLRLGLFSLRTEHVGHANMQRDNLVVVVLCQSEHTA